MSNSACLHVCSHSYFPIQVIVPNVQIGYLHVPLFPQLSQYSLTLSSEHLNTFEHCSRTLWCLVSGTQIYHVDICSRTQFVCLTLSFACLCQIPHICMFGIHKCAFSLIPGHSYYHCPSCPNTISVLSQTRLVCWTTWDMGIWMFWTCGHEFSKWNIVLKVVYIL